MTEASSVSSTCVNIRSRVAEEEEEEEEEDEEMLTEVGGDEEEPFSGDDGRDSGDSCSNP